MNVTQTPGIFTWLPRIAADPDGDEVFALWQEIVFSGGSHGGEILFARSTNGGRTFSEPINLSNTTAGCGKGRITGDVWHNGSLDLGRRSDGTLFAAWTEFQGPLRFSRSTDGGVSFEKPVHVAGDNAMPARGPAIAMGGDGLVYLAWAVGEDPGGDIRLAVSRDDGRTFSKPQVVEDTENYSDAPKLVVDSKGEVHLVWAEGSDGYDGPDHLRYVRIDGDGEGRPRRLPSVDAAPASFPYLSIDADDRIFLAWEHYPGPNGQPTGIGFSISGDRGQSFSKPALVPEPGYSKGFNANLQGRLTDKIAVGEDGTVALVNSKFVPQTRSNVLLFRGTLPRRID